MSNPHDAPMQLIGCVLCGGQSRRMGRAKALLRRPDGVTYLEHAAQRLSKCCDRLVVSLPFDTGQATADGSRKQNQEIVPDGSSDQVLGISELQSLDRQSFDLGDVQVAFVVDRSSDRGPAEGLACVLRYAEAAGADAVLCTPVDLPDLTTEDCRRLTSAWRTSPQTIHCAVAQPSGRLQPLVAVYPIRLTAAIDQMALSQQRSLARWLESQSYAAVVLSDASLRNVNTPRDLDQ